MYVASVRIILNFSQGILVEVQYNTGLFGNDTPLDTVSSSPYLLVPAGAHFLCSLSMNWVT